MFGVVFGEEPEAFRNYVYAFIPIERRPSSVLRREDIRDHTSYINTLQKIIDMSKVTENYTIAPGIVRVSEIFKMVTSRKVFRMASFSKRA